jgi:hypothetical protein
MNDLALSGLSLPAPAYLFGALLFGLIGFAAFRYGKRVGRPRTRVIGVVLMLYPYLITRTLWLYAVGTVLCVGLFLDRD